MRARDCLDSSEDPRDSNHEHESEMSRIDSHEFRQQEGPHLKSAGATAAQRRRGRRPRAPSFRLAHGRAAGF